VLRREWCSPGSGSRGPGASPQPAAPLLSRLSFLSYARRRDAAGLCSARSLLCSSHIQLYAGQRHYRPLCPLLPAHSQFQCGARHGIEGPKLPSAWGLRFCVFLILFSQLLSPGGGSCISASINGICVRLPPPTHPPRLAPTAHWLPGHCCSPLQCIAWGPQRCLAPGLRSTPPNNTRRTSSHTRTPWAGAPLLLQRPGWVLLCVPRGLPKVAVGLATSASWKWSPRTEERPLGRDRRPQHG
jgi:hypothetical protein